MRESNDTQWARNLPPGRALLFVAHPGHELRVYGWLTVARPVVLVLTDGSGRSGQSRVPSTLATLAETGAEVGGWCGELSDAAAYAAILASDTRELARALDAAVAAVLERDVAYAVGDAIEGYNPVHDVCRLVLGGAVEVVRRRGRVLPCFDFPLVGRPNACAEELRPRAIELVLGEELLERKLAAARRDPDLAIDVDDALRAAGAEAFRMELLRPSSSPAAGTDGLPDEPPLYECFGEQRVEAGKYAGVLRRAHVLGVARAIERLVEDRAR